jgi:Cu/Zn superoxide dismutase
VGDVGNVVADASGNLRARAPAPAARAARRRGGCASSDARAAAQVAFEEPVITLSGPNSVEGRSVVLHAEQDDYVSEPAAILAFGTLVAQ